MFPSSSQVIPQYFCNSTSDYLSHMVCPKFKSHVYKLKRWVMGEHICFYFVTGVQRGASIGECPMFQKHCLMGQSMWLLQNKIKDKVVSAPMNYNINIESHYEPYLELLFSSYGFFFFHIGLLVLSCYCSTALF
jgi:hypothetical protein